MKRFSFLKKLLATALAAFTLLSFASCKDTSWVVSAGKDEVNAGVYLGYLVDAYYNAAYSVTDTTKDLFDQKIDGVKAEEYIKNSAMESCKNFIVVERLFNEYKLSFSDEEKESFEESFASVWDSVSELYSENGCGKESLKKIMLADEKYQKIFEYYYSKDGKEPVSEKERKEFFTKNYAKIKYISVDYSAHFSGVDTASDASEAQKTELKALAEDYVKRLEKGEDIDLLISEENKAAEQLKEDEEEEEEHDHDHEHEEEEEVQYTFLQKDTSDDPDAFNKKIFATKTGVPTLYDNTTYGYYIFVRYKINADSEDYTDRTDDIISAMKSEDFAKIIEKEIKNIKINENSAAIKRFKPQNVVINY